MLQDLQDILSHELDQNFGEIREEGSWSLVDAAGGTVPAGWRNDVPSKTTAFLVLARVPPLEEPQGFPEQLKYPRLAQLVQFSRVHPNRFVIDGKSAKLALRPAFYPSG